VFEASLRVEYSSESTYLEDPVVQRSTQTVGGDDGPVIGTSVPETNRDGSEVCNEAERARIKEELRENELILAMRDYYEEMNCNAGTVNNKAALSRRC
jgi:hypothetical protein